ncbi:MAG TPA: hypothetical protein VKX28_26745 [Xanthobacteraceae bacterium]|nr:hypothetical protein [Xanthobacteraceae bacterium]
MNDALHRILTGSGVTRRQLFWGAFFIVQWWVMDAVGFYLDHVAPALAAKPTATLQFSTPTQKSTADEDIWRTPNPFPFYTRGRMLWCDEHFRCSRIGFIWGDGTVVRDI